MLNNWKKNKRSKRSAAKLLDDMHGPGTSKRIFRRVFWYKVKNYAGFYLLLKIRRRIKSFFVG